MDIGVFLVFLERIIPSFLKLQKQGFHVRARFLEVSCNILMVLTVQSVIKFFSLAVVFQISAPSAS